MATKTIGQLTQATTINNADEFAIEQSGVTKRVTAGVVRGDIVNANIKSDAAIAFSKLATLNSAQIIVGNGSNVPTAVSVTGDVTISNAGVTTLARPYTLATSQASTSGTSIDFTGIPSWAKRITVVLSSVSTNGTSNIVVRLGTSSGIQESSYASATAVITSAPATAVVTESTGIVVAGMSSTSSLDAVFTIVNQTGNVWFLSGNSRRADGATTVVGMTCGGTTLSTVLDRVRITTAGGTNTFDAGTINIAYEG